MAYTDQQTSYSTTTPYGRDDVRATTYERGRHDPGVTIFLWLAWALAAAFQAATLTTAFHIFASPAPAMGAAGGADAGGIAWLLIDVIGGVVVLGLALAWGLSRYVTRDKSKDPATERATHALYDQIERQGGEDLTTRSPEARTATERDAYRDSDPSLR